MSFKVEKAKSGRATCVKCKTLIPKDSIKVVRSKLNSFAGRMTTESICGSCGLGLLDAEIVKLQAAAEEIKKAVPAPSMPTLA